LQDYLNDVDINIDINDVLNNKKRMEQKQGKKKKRGEHGEHSCRG